MINHLHRSAPAAIIVVVFFIAAAIIVPSHAIRCYDCTVLTCPLFNESRSYEVDCPNSTMCLKRIYPYKLTTGETLETFERSCANQLDKSMAYVHTKGWVDDHSIVEPYTEDCRKMRKDSDSIYCYCRGALCNSAPSTKESSSYHTDAMAVIFVFNAMKYLRSME